jgi:hypothetical protein
VVNAPDWHDELVLVAELASVNNQIARFVLRLLDADAGRREQVAACDEYSLGCRLVDLGHALQNRADHRGRAHTEADGGAIDDCVSPGPRSLALEKVLARSGCGIR